MDGRNIRQGVLATRGVLFPTLRPEWNSADREQFVGDGGCLVPQPDIPPWLRTRLPKDQKETARRSGLHLIRDPQVHRKTDFLIGRIDAALEVRRIAIDPLDVVSEKLLVPAASTLRGLRSKKDGT
jgi:hypothetical protein